MPRRLLPSDIWWQAHPEIGKLVDQTPGGRTLGFVQPLPTSSYPQLSDFAEHGLVSENLVKDKPSNSFSKPELNASKTSPSAIAKLAPLKGVSEANKDLPLMASGASKEQQASGLSSGDTGGPPVFITDPHGIASIAGASVKEGAVEIANKTVESAKKLAEEADKDTKSVVAEASKDTGIIEKLGINLGNFIGNLLSGPAGLFARIGVGLVAIVLLSFGLWMSAGEHERPQSV